MSKGSTEVFLKDQLTCECGHVAGTPATLRVHKSMAHPQEEKVEKVTKVAKKKK